jgi:PKD repeat protein
MKKIFYLSLILPLFLFSCESIPEAHFITDITEPEVGQDIYFTNDSRNAVEYEWDFGDGYVSNDENPVHNYTATGVYDIVLTAYSKKGLEDKATMTIEIFMPSLLVIEVLEYYEGYTVPDASVYLYPDSTSWDNSENLVNEGYTDIDGLVVFSNLDFQKYYVDVLEENHNNYDLRSEDVGFITTSELAPHKITWFVAWVDVIQPGKGLQSRDKTYVVRKIGRKADDKIQTPATKVTEDWQNLYNRSVKVK